MLLRTKFNWHWAFNLSNHRQFISVKKDCNHYFKWTSIQRWLGPIYNGTLEIFVWFSINYIPVFFFLYKLFIFICGFSAIGTSAFLAYQKEWRKYKNLTLFDSEKIFHNFIELDMFSRVTLQIWHILM